MCGVEAIKRMHLVERNPDTIERSVFESGAMGRSLEGDGANSGRGRNLKV